MTMGVGLYYYGLRDTTPTYALNFLNLVPILTFLLSIVARIEKLGLDSRARKVKTVGVTLCVAGAVTTGIYEGKTFQLHIGHHRHSQTSLNTLLLAHWPRGTALLIGSCLSVAIWFILQGKLLKAFPSKYHATMLTCLVASFQSMVIGLCMNRQKAAWGLGWDLQLLTIIYSGALATAASFCLIPWAIANRGPTYPAMFNPLSSIFTAVSAALILGEAITVGMVLGMVLIIVGLYGFLWGKRNEMEHSQPPPNAGIGDPVTLVPESAVVQSRAAVMPTTDYKIDLEQQQQQKQGSDKH